MVKCSLRVGKPAEYEWAEVMQRWIAPNGEHVTFTRLRQTMGTLYYDLWLFYTPLELRKENHIFNLVHSGTVCPFMSVTHELRKRGALLTDNRMETLLKTGQTKLLRHFMEHPQEEVEDYWQSIRICNRNGYKVYDAVTWCDYIDALKYLGKDVRNMKYVCPQNLSREHDKACRKVVEKELEKEMNGNTPKFLSKEHCYLLSKGGDAPLRGRIPYKERLPYTFRYHQREADRNGGSVIVTDEGGTMQGHMQLQHQIPRPHHQVGGGQCRADTTEDECGMIV